MKLLPLLTLVILAGCTNRSYFPERSVENPYHESNWYGKYYTEALRSFKEPSLFHSKNKRLETYRFLWLRTFDNPVVIKLEIPNEGEATLTTKVASGRSVYEFGNIVKNENKRIERAIAAEFAKALDESAFWESAITRWHPDEEEVDGAEWVVEGVKSGKYHVVTDLSPEEGITRFIGDKLIKLSGLSINEEEYY